MRNTRKKQIGKEEDRDTIMDVDQLAQYLKVSKRTVYRLVAAGEIPHIRIAGMLRFPFWKIIEWIESIADESSKCQIQLPDQSRVEEE